MGLRGYLVGSVCVRRGSRAHSQIRRRRTQQTLCPAKSRRTVCEPGIRWHGVGSWACDSGVMTADLDDHAGAFRFLTRDWDTKSVTTFDAVLAAEGVDVVRIWSVAMPR
jgi:hypothetical protein